MSKKIIALALAVICLLWLCSCGEADNTSVGFIVPKTGIEYVFCGVFSVYAVEKGDEYIKYSGEQLYEVEFESPEDFLCVEDSGELLVYRRKDIGDITLENFEPIAAQIYDSSNTRWIASFFADDEYLPEEDRGVNTSQDSELCAKIAQAITEGENVEIDSENIAYSNQYYIRLLSQKYPGLYYMVWFYGDTDGRFYLRDRSAKKSVECPRDILARMIGTDDYDPDTDEEVVSTVDL